MKKIPLLLLCHLAAPLAAFSQTAFTPGDLVVERVGDGTTTLSSAATQVSALEYSAIGGPAVQTITMPAAATQPSSPPFNATDSGTATGNGMLNLSADGSVITVSGYNATVGTASVAGSSSSTISRTVGVLSASGSVNTSTSLNVLTGQNFRTVVSDNGAHFWLGTGGGIAYVSAIGSTGTNNLTTILNNNGNTRSLEIYNGQLYASTQSASFNGAGGALGIFAVGNGLPTATVASGSVTLLINTGSNSMPCDYSLFDTDNNGSPDVAFVADERAAAGGGISRYDLLSGVWTQRYSLNLSTTVTTGTGTLASSTGLGLRGLAVKYDGSTFSLFGTTASVATVDGVAQSTNANALISLVDNAIFNTAPTSYNLLEVSGGNFAFRGADFTPGTQVVPEPATWATLLVGLGAFSVFPKFRRRR